MQLVQFENQSLPGAQVALMNLNNALPLTLSLILFLPVALAGDREPDPHFVSLEIAKGRGSILIAAIPSTVEAAIRAALKTSDDSTIGIPPLRFGTGVTETSMEEIVLTRADRGLVRDAMISQRVLLELEETPSTGYRWAIEISPANAVKILESRWVAPIGTGVGAAGKREFSLRIEQHGEIRLQAKLWREWQGDGSVIQREEFILRVP